MNCENRGEFLKKFKMVLLEYSGAGGKLIHEKNRKQKNLRHCPFKYAKQKEKRKIKLSPLICFLVRGNTEAGVLAKKNLRLLSAA